MNPSYPNPAANAAGSPPNPAANAAGSPLPSSTRPVRAELADLLRKLQPGQRIRITQTVAINTRRRWNTTVEGTFRGVNFLVTGLATERVPEDDIVVVTVHFTKANGELSSITLDDNSQVEAM